MIVKNAAEKGIKILEVPQFERFVAQQMQLRTFRLSSINILEGKRRSRRQ